MSHRSIQDILPLVQMPSRYLGVEVNRRIKPWDGTRMHVALAFPDLYEIATSHFGIQILYDILNKEDDVLAERVFAPAMDMEKQLRDNHQPLGTLESQTELSCFDLIGFSLLYELNYTNMVNMLDLGNIPLLAAQRDGDHPFVIAGGPCMCNPEPVADFFDAIVVGDGEAVILAMVKSWKQWRSIEDRSRHDLLEAWSQIKGVYVPSFFKLDETCEAAKAPAATRDNYPHVQRAVLADLNDAHFPGEPILPFGKPIHDRLRMEIARGCTRGCRFCQAGMIYRPVRERKPDSIVELVRKSLADTGYEDISLLSLSTGDYSCIAPLMQQIMAFGEKDKVAVSLPSLRAGSLTPELMNLIRKVRKTGFTIAPEAGSQRMRDVINKNISEADIIETVENAFSLGWKLIKLYFMIGLPTETWEDVEAIVLLVKRLREVKGSDGRKPRINVSVATFVPKPHTPFQWDAQIPLEEAEKRIQWIREQLRLPGLQVKWQDPRVSVVEGVWSRGDRRLSKSLIHAWERGCRFDGWSDHFNFDHWLQIFQETGINVSQYASEKNTDQELPWDHIRIGVDRSFLIKERQRAQQGTITRDCRTGKCSLCGVCDFKELKPVSFHEESKVECENFHDDANSNSEAHFRYGVEFSKMGPVRFLGHLEMVKVFIRALRRAGLPLKYSQGFHPMPKVSFGDTLPMGMQSEGETMNIVLTEAVRTDEIVDKIARQLPDGFELLGSRATTRKMDVDSDQPSHYRVEITDGNFLQKDVDSFWEEEDVSIQRRNKKGRPVKIDLKEAVVDLNIRSNQKVRMVLGKHNGQTVRPAMVLKSVFHLSDSQILQAVITKCKGGHV